MAGAGFRTFSAGEVLTAANTQNYLMEQSVMVFADTTARDAAITSPSEGMFAYLTGTNLLTFYNGSAWEEFTSGGGGVTVSATAPASPDDGALWWDSDDGELYLYYNDGTSSQWVAAAGPSVTVAATAPTGYEGQLWLDSTDGSMYVYYTDPGGGNAQWIGAVSRSGGILQVVSTTKTDTFATTSGTDVDITGLSASITPRSTSSKILVLVSAPFSTTTNQINSITLTRGGTPIGGGAIVGSRTSAFRSAYLTSTNTGGMLSGEHLDSPSTASTITYQVQCKTSAGTMTIGISGGDSNAANHPRTASTITLMEVAG
tara:strand:- start:4 stop:951 length:948 start_codon:yes stop_codon:yes gene_type:complete